MLVYGCVFGKKDSLSCGLGLICTWLYFESKDSDAAGISCEMIVVTWDIYSFPLVKYFLSSELYFHGMSRLQLSISHWLCMEQWLRVTPC